MHSSIIAASALVASASAGMYYPTANESTPVFVYDVVTSFETYCPEATTIVYKEKTYTATEECTLTITNCPCTITTPVATGTETPMPCLYTETYAAPVYTSSVVAAPVYKTVSSSVITETPVVTYAAVYAAPSPAAPVAPAKPAAPAAPVAAANVSTPVAPKAALYSAAADKAFAASGAGLAGLAGLLAFVL